MYTHVHRCVLRVTRYGLIMPLYYCQTQSRRRESTVKLPLLRSKRPGKVLLHLPWLRPGVIISCYRPKEIIGHWRLEPSVAEIGLCPSFLGVGWFPTLLWLSKGLIGQNTYREGSLHNGGGYPLPTVPAPSGLSHSREQPLLTLLWQGHRPRSGSLSAAGWEVEGVSRQPSLPSLAEDSQLGKHRTGWGPAGERTGCWAKGGK